MIKFRFAFLLQTFRVSHHESECSNKLLTLFPVAPLWLLPFSLGHSQILPPHTECGTFQIELFLTPTLSRSHSQPVALRLAYQCLYINVAKKTSWLLTPWTHLISKEVYYFVRMVISIDAGPQRDNVTFFQRNSVPLQFQQRFLRQPSQGSRWAAGGRLSRPRPPAGELFLVRYRNKIIF